MLSRAASDPHLNLIASMNEENVMRVRDNNDRQQSIAGHVRRQPVRGVQRRNVHKYAMTNTFISGFLAFLIMAYPAHVSAQQAESAGKVAQSPGQTAEASFMAENQAAMSKMMKGMAVKPSGNVDADFTAMMIPHHQGAVDMAKAELRYGHNRKLRRIARNIIAEQQQQIRTMKAALGHQPATQLGSASQDDAGSAPKVAR
jgi:hypothetical protein